MTMVYRDRRTGRTIEIGDNERVKRETLEQAGWQRMDAQPAPKPTQPVVAPPQPTPTPVVAAPPVIEASTEEVKVTILDPVVVTPDDEAELDSVLAGDKVEEAPIVQPEPVTEDRKAATAKKAGRPKKQAHVWMGNLPDDEE